MLYSRGLVGYWPFENTALDASGNGNDGTLQGDPTYAAGKVGRCLSFDDATSDYVLCGDIDAIEMTDVTVAFWAKLDNLTVDREFITKADSHATDKPLLIWYDFAVHSSYPDKGNNNVKTLSVLSYDGDTQHWVAGTSNVLDNSNWNHIGVTLNAATGEIIIYINGILNQSNTKAAWDGIQATGDEVRFGYLLNKTLDGSLDEISIWSRVLTETDIRRVMMGMAPIG